MTAGESVREHLLADTDRLRAYVADVIAGPANRFRWLDSDLWIDRERLLVLSAHYAKGIGVLDEPVAPAGLLEREGPTRSTTSVDAMMDFLGALAEGLEKARRARSSCAQWINLAVIEAMLDPAGSSMCWLILDYGCRPQHAHPFSIGELAAPLLADLTLLPAERAASDARRAAQVAFVRDKFVSTLEPSWELASDEEWAQRCAEIARDAKFVWDHIADRGARQRQ